MAEPIPQSDSERKAWRCERPGCLGHADERTAEVRCQRCRGKRWILVRPASAPDPEYTCQRCEAVLAGKNAADPLGTEAQRASPGRFGAGFQALEPAN